MSALVGILFLSRLAVPIDLAALTAPPKPTPKPLRVGTVNMQRMFAALPSSKEVQSISEARGKEIAAEYQQLVSRGKPKRAARVKKHDEEDLARETAKFGTEIGAVIRDHVKVLAGRREIDLVFDSSAQSLNGTTVLLGTAPGFDLTDELLNDPGLLDYRILPK